MSSLCKRGFVKPTGFELVLGALRINLRKLGLCSGWAAIAGRGNSIIGCLSKFYLEEGTPTVRLRL